MKKGKNTLELSIGIASLFMSVLSVASLVWIGSSKLSTIVHEVQDIKEDVRELKVEVRRVNDRLDNMEGEFHKIDIRVNTLEQTHKGK